MFTHEEIDHFLQGYTPNEVKTIEKDLRLVDQLSFDGLGQYTALYLAAVGAPASQRGATLASFLEHHDAMGKAVAPYKGYDHDHDHEQLYLSQALGLDSRAVRSIAHKITSTGSEGVVFLEKVKSSKTHFIKLLLCYSPDEVRLEKAGRNTYWMKEENRYSNKPSLNDIIESGKQFPESFDLYFQQANELVFYWNTALYRNRHNLHEPCAKCINTFDGPLLTVLKEDEWLLFCQKYLDDISRHNIPVCEIFRSLIPETLFAEDGSIISVRQQTSRRSDGVSAAEFREEWSLHSHEVLRNQSTAPSYIATAGGPGSAKTTTLETFLRQNNLMGRVVYADPDAVSLKVMANTYRQSLTAFDFAQAPSSHAALKAAYAKWRGASNYITRIVLQKAFGGEEQDVSRLYSVAHGTTSTSSDVPALFEKIKLGGYQIKLLLCYSQDDTRKQRILRRETEQGFVQSDPKDVIEKGKLFPQTFDTYFQYADELTFYWNEALTHGKLPKPCAKYDNTGDEPVLTILKEDEWLLFCKKYLADIKQLNIPICEKFKPHIPKSLLVDDNLVMQVVNQLSTYTTELMHTMTAQLAFWSQPAASSDDRPAEDAHRNTN
jgi:hypothetical protein